MDIVSLGGNCSVAYQLNKLQLRYSSYPFDWCRIKINKLIQVLNNNFAFYENIVFKKKSLNHENNIIVKNNYNIEFAHEIVHKYEINEFKLTLLKRIERFRQLNNPIFIRLECENLGNNKMILYQKLEDLLKLYFNNFKIILISKNKYESQYTTWYKLPKFSEDWKYDYLDWKDIIFNNILFNNINNNK